MSMKLTSLRSAGALVILLGTFCEMGAAAEKSVPCRFAAEYQRIKSDKSDPRVAYIENYAIWHAQEAKDDENAAWDPFQEACKDVARQSTGTTTFFDAAHKYLQIYTSEGGNVYSEAVTYFAGMRGHEGVILRSQDDADHFSANVLVFRGGKWLDVTADYFSSLKLDHADFIVAPQFGRGARVLHFEQRTASFSPKGWLIWNGETFEFSTAKSFAGWRCPDTSAKFFTSEFFGADAPSELKKRFCR